MVVGAYLMGSTGVRFKDGCGVEIKWLQGQIPKVNGRMKPSDVKIRAELVFKQVPVRMSNFVIVNSGLSTFDLIQATVEVAEKYADNIMVIPPLLARLSFGLEQLANPIMEKIPVNEVILVVTIVKEFSDFIVLRRDQNFKLYVDSHEIYKREECDEMFARFYDYYFPDSNVFLVHEDFHDLAKNVRSKYRPERSFLKVFKRWDFMLFFGGLYRAIDNEEEYDLRYHIPNFSNGYEAIVRRKNGPNINHILLPERSKVPCDMYGFDGIPQNIKIRYCTEFVQVFDDLRLARRFATEKNVHALGSSKEIIGHIDERGVPYANPRKTIATEKVVEETAEATYISNMELAVDFSTTNICEYNTSIKAKLIQENVFDPSKLSSSIKQLTNVLKKNPISALHVIIDKDIPDEYNDLFYTCCNNVTYIPHIKAQLSYCFKKLQHEENIETFAIVLVGTNHLMDFLLFEFRSGHYYFIQRVQDLDAKDVEMKLKREYVKDAFVFLQKGVQCSIKPPNKDVTVNVFEVRDYKNMALNGIFDMDENLEDLANTKELKELFSLTEYNKGRSSRTSDTSTFSQSSTSMNLKQDKERPCFPQVDVIFAEENIAVDVYQNGNNKTIKNADGNEWIPLYLSMAQGRPEIGEKAKNDYEKFPKYVIYDILKIIGTSLNEIQIDPKWGFELTVQNGNVHFQVETPSGPILITQELVVSAFLKAMKLRAESEMDTQIKEIRLSTNFKLTESQKTIFNKAALKNNLEITSFNVTGY